MIVRGYEEWGRVREASSVQGLLLRSEAPELDDLSDKTGRSGVEHAPHIAMFAVEDVWNENVAHEPGQGREGAVFGQVVHDEYDLRVWILSGSVRIVLDTRREETHEALDHLHLVHFPVLELAQRKPHRVQIVGGEVCQLLLQLLTIGAH